MRLERGEMHKYLTFVVDGAAAVDLPVANRRLEGRRLPERDRIFGLDVVVAVDQHGRRARRTEPLAVCHGQPRRLEHLGAREPGRTHPRHDRLGAPAHLPVPSRIGRHRLAGDEGPQLVEIAVGMLASVGGGCVVDHMSSVSRPAPPPIGGVGYIVSQTMLSFV